MKKSLSKKTANIIKAVVFILLLVVSIAFVSSFFGLDEISSYEHQADFLKENKDSLDAVYFGGSDVHVLFQPAFAWEKYGIAVWDYSVNTVQPESIKYFMDDVHKRQPNALYIISINSFKREPSEDGNVEMHRNLDYMPFSFNKLALTHELTTKFEKSPIDSLEYYLPIIRFHSRWDELDSFVFGASSIDYKGSRHTANFTSDVYDISKRYFVKSDRVEVQDNVLKAFNDVLDYCDKQKLNAIFVKVPQVIRTEWQGRMNTMEDLAVSRGYPVINMMENTAEFNIDFSMDYYDLAHTNVHGSKKLTDYFAKYLVDNYHFEDKRGKPGWESWDKAADSYMKYLNTYIFPFEFDDSPRIDTDVPKLNSLKVSGTTATLTWSPVENATKYYIYRKAGSGEWKRINSVDADKTSYTSKNLAKSTTYTYTVVPVVKKGGVMYYGDFNVKGLSGKTGA